jgi:hypothetical protein
VVHWFGTDNLGRDILAEIVYGMRVSIAVAACASALAILIGVSVAVVGIQRCAQPARRGELTVASSQRLPIDFHRRVRTASAPASSTPTSMRW